MNIPNIVPNTQNTQLESLQKTNELQTARKIAPTNPSSSEPAVDNRQESVRQQQSAVNILPATATIRDPDGSQTQQITDPRQLEPEYLINDREKKESQENDANSQENTDPRREQRRVDPAVVDRNNQDAERARQAEIREAEFAEIRALKKRDLEVRNHEAAHLAAGGQYTGQVRYTTVTGPNGVNYAVGGEVSIDVSPIAGDPEATIQKMQRVRLAALAPADPSPQDLKVAALASSIERQARQDLLSAQQEEARRALDDAGQLIRDSENPTQFDPLDVIENRALELSPQSRRRALAIENYYQNSFQVHTSASFLISA